MTADYRDLITRMAKELDNYRQLLLDDRTVTHRLSDEARAALADEPAVPLPLADAVATVESECLYFLTTATGRSLTPDLIESLYGQFRGIIAGLVDALALANAPAAPAPPADGEVARCLADSLKAFLLTQDLADYPADHWSRRAAELLQRQVTVQPAEVAELVSKLQRLCSDLDYDDRGDDAGCCYRAAELLQRQAMVPVAVSERLQQMEGLAADAVAGLRYIEESHGRLYGVGWDRVYDKADRLKPAHALPLPEVNNG